MPFALVCASAKPLGFRPPKALARFFLVIASAASISSCSRPSPGLLELHASREAVRAAKSWQSGTTAQFPTGQYVILTLERIECPGRYDRTGLLHDQGNRSVHEIQIDSTYYNKDNAPRTWTSNPAPSETVINCGQGPSLTWDGIPL
jgi:hypothetical protein